MDINTLNSKANKLRDMIYRGEYGTAALILASDNDLSKAETLAVLSMVWGSLDNQNTRKFMDQLLLEVGVRI